MTHYLMNSSGKYQVGSLVLKLQDLKISREIRGTKPEYHKPQVNIHREININIIRPEQKADSKLLTINDALLGNTFERDIRPRTANTQNAQQP